MGFVVLLSGCCCATVEFVVASFCADVVVARVYVCFVYESNRVVYNINLLLLRKHHWMPNHGVLTTHTSTIWLIHIGNLVNQRNKKQHYRKCV